MGEVRRSILGGVCGVFYSFAHDRRQVITVGTVVWGGQFVSCSADNNLCDWCVVRVWVCREDLGYVGECSTICCTG